jgi:hypothetical protein
MPRCYLSRCSTNHRTIKLQPDLQVPSLCTTGLVIDGSALAIVQIGFEQRLYAQAWILIVKQSAESLAISATNEWSTFLD